MSVRILAIAGSLQARSSNGALIAAASDAATSMEVQWAQFDRLGDVPLLNPDLDGESAPAAVTALRAAVAGCDGLLIATPEYAHGMPGLLKNALDWLVGSGELAGKPVALVAASPTPTGGVRALLMLTATLLAQAAEVVALVPVPAVRGKVDTNGVLSDAAARRRIGEALAALVETAVERAGERRRGEL